MSCAGCAANVQRSLEAAPGVHGARVSLSEGLAFIEARQPVDPRELSRIVEARGFAARPLPDAVDPLELRGEAEARHASVARAWRFRAIIGLSVWIPLEALHWLVHGAWVDWVLLLGSTIVMVVAGEGFFRSAWNAARHRTTNMDTLVSLGAGTAWAYSLVAFVARFAGHDLGPLYFAESSALLGIISLGHWIESRATVHAGSALAEMLRQQPDVAIRIGERGEETIASRDVRPGDHLRIRPGARIPVDGVVVSGESELDESLMTGESAPVPRAAGDAVVAGSVNAQGTLVIEAATSGRETTITRMARLVQEAQASRAPVQRLADRICAVFVPAVLLIAMVAFLGWAVAGAPVKGLIAAVTVLIISCPCALGLATPLAVTVGVGEGGRRGLLVRQASTLERAARAQRVTFDKTGTLTHGKPQVIRFEVGDLLPERDVLQFAASAEAASEHPFARAIVRYADARDVPLLPASAFRAIAGSGVVAQVAGREIRVERDAESTCRIVVDGATVGRFAMLDEVREDAPDAVAALRAMHLSVHLLSGDSAAVAGEIGRRCGLEPPEIHAEVSPERKRAFVAEAGAGTVMVGDGVNDAAALAAADVGIALASGTNVAMESAHVVIPGDHVMAVPQFIDLARRTMRTIRQNLLFAFLYNAMAIPAAALGLLGMHGPLIAAAAMALSDLTVVGNSLRLRADLARARRRERSARPG